MDEAFAALAELMERTPWRPAGLRGTRRRRLDEIRREGLSRAHSGWFEVGSATPCELAATVALATYFGLGLRSCAELAEVPTGGFRRWFAARPDALPALVLFGPVCGGARDRYLSLAPACPGPTAPYTNVGRGGVAIPGPLADGVPAPAGLSDVEAAEEEAARRCRAAPEVLPDGVRFLVKLPGGEPAGPLPPPVHSRIGWFCSALGRRLAARLVEVARVD